MKIIGAWLFIIGTMLHAGGVNIPPPTKPIVIPVDKPHCGCPCPKKD